MANNDNGGVGEFGGADNEIAAICDLRNAAGSGGDFGEGESLD